MKKDESASALKLIPKSVSIAADPLPDDPATLRDVYRKTSDELKRRFGSRKKRRADLLEATPALQRLFELRGIEIREGLTAVEASEFGEILSGLDNAEKEDWKEIQLLSHIGPDESAMNQMLKLLRQKAARLGIQLLRTKSDPHTGSAAKKFPVKKLSARAKAIRAAIKNDKRRHEYPNYLDGHQVKPPSRWTDEGCPPSYKEIYTSNNKKWKQHMWDERDDEKRRMMKENSPSN